MCAYFGRVGAAFGTAGSYFFLGDLLPMLEPGAATLARARRVSVYYFHFHSNSNLWDCGENGVGTISLNCASSMLGLVEEVTGHPGRLSAPSPANARPCP